jgi:SAM-dependent methyltransferase
MEPNEYSLMASVEDRHWWWRARREILARTIERYAPPAVGGERKVLEVGCGTGGNLAMLARFGSVLGAEPEAAAIAFLREKHGRRFEVIEHSIPQRIPGRFHIVGMFDVLEHIEDDAGVLRWIGDLLEPGGVAVITVPAFAFLWSEHDDAAHHVRRYTVDGLRRIVPPELKIAHLTYFNSLLFPPVAAVRLILRCLPRAWQLSGTHMGLPSAPFNWLFYHLFRTERHVAPRFRSPAGVSVLLVLRRRPGSS